VASEELHVSEPVSKIDWSTEQRHDPVLRRVFDLISSDSFVRGRKHGPETPQVQRFMRELPHLFVQENVLYRTATLDGKKVKQLVLPSSHQQIALQGWNG
jgi:hypothetical protein